MSNAVSALNGATHAGIATVSEAGLSGMITIRGDFTDADFVAAVTKATGCAMPDALRITFGDDGALGWMSPDELLWICGHDAAQSGADALAAALADQHAMVSNVSDARALFEVTGPSAREVVSKLAPVDFAPDVFTAGSLRRSHLAQVPAAYWLDDAGVFRIMCFRSVARYAFDTLAAVAADGSAVGLWD